jgi:hypothetical protein
MANVLERQWKSEWCAGLLSRPVGLGGDDYNNINNVNANNNFNNNGRARGIEHSLFIEDSGLSYL